MLVFSVTGGHPETLRKHLSPGLGRLVKSKAITPGQVSPVPLMSVTVLSSPSRFQRLAARAWWLLLPVALALLGVATSRRMAHVESLTNRPTWAVDAPVRDAKSPTGFAHGQRQLIVPGSHSPSFWWIMEAQQAAAQGHWRLHHIDYDAPPAGREMRRTSPYRWWLITIGWLHETFFGGSLGYGIERGALMADPLLLILLVIVGSIYCSRCLGSFAAVGFIAGAVSLFPLVANFQPGAPDPHSFAWVLALGAILPLLAAFRAQGTTVRTRIHFVLAGIFGGLGFWNDATSQAPVLLAIAFGALVAEFVRTRDGQTPPTPSHWRAWALAGAVTTLAASLFEFAPDRLSWSLDAVHPIHAIVWWGMGELLHAVSVRFRAPQQRFDRSSLLFPAVGLLAIATWPVAGMLKHTGALSAPDFYAIELANDPAGGLASNLGAWLSRSGNDLAKWATLLPVAILLLLGLRVAFGKSNREMRARLVFVLVGASVALVLAVFQLRWWALFDVFALAGLTALFVEAETANPRLSWPILGALLLMLPGLFAGFPSAKAGAADREQLSPQDAGTLVARDFSHWLVERHSAAPTVLFSTPVFSGAATFYGGFDVAVSGDDGYAPGREMAVRVASADSEEEISVLLKSRGITHIALPSWDPILDQLVRVGMKLPQDQPLPPNTFAVALKEWVFPLWMGPMDYVIPNQRGFEGFGLKVFTIEAVQDRDLALSRLADFFVQRGQLPEAQAARDALRAYSRSVAALGAIASIDVALRDGADLEKSLETLVPMLSRRAARDLPVDRRIGIATVLLQTRKTDLAREQLALCFNGLNADTLRTLNLGSIVELLTLSQSLQAPFPSRELEKVALRLIPPGVRTNFVEP